MKYLIMILIVIGLAIADYLTGIIKAYCTGDICSKKMRIGGLNKLSEIIIMFVVCGLDIGINELGRYYEAVELSGIAGAVTAVSVFLYITVMEIVSILENYAEINPQAKWTASIIRHLKNYKESGKNDADK